MTQLRDQLGRFGIWRGAWQVTPPLAVEVERAGYEPLLAPEQKVVLEADPERARAIGRPRVQKPYLGLVNYTSNLRRLGFSAEDLSDAGVTR